jgi:hypothetical protein
VNHEEVLATDSQVMPENVTFGYMEMIDAGLHLIEQIPEST